MVTTKLEGSTPPAAAGNASPPTAEAEAAPVSSQAPPTSYEYVGKKVDPDLECAICHEPMIDPVLLPDCSHMFCRRCITETLSARTVCPLCQTKPTVDLLVKAPYPLKNRLDSLEVFCPVNRCHVARHALSDHIPTCPRECPQGCGDKIAPKDDARHELICNSVTLSCPRADLLCEWTGERRFLDGHLEECKKKSLEPVVRHLLSKVDKLTEALEYTTKLVFHTRFQLQDSFLSSADYASPTPSSLDVSNVSLKDANLHGWRFQNVRLPLDISSTAVREGTFEGLNLDQISLPKDLRNVDLAGVDLSNRDFTNCDMTGSNLCRTNLKGAKLPKKIQNVNLSGANLSDQDLSGADLTGSNLAGSNLIGTKLPKHLRRVNLSCSNLSNHDLSRCDLSGSNLSGSNLSGSNLQDAILQKCNLSKANFTSCNVDNVDFSSSSIILSGAVFDCDISKCCFRGRRFKYTGQVHKYQGAEYCHRCSSYRTTERVAFTLPADDVQVAHVEKGVEVRYAYPELVRDDFKCSLDHYKYFNKDKRETREVKTVTNGKELCWL